MSDKNTKTKETIDVDPTLLMDSIDEVNKLVNSHVVILETIRDLIKKYMESGMKPDEAAGLAMTLHKRAAEKARDLVPNTDPIKEEK